VAKAIGYTGIEVRSNDERALKEVLKTGDRSRGPRVGSPWSPTLHPLSCPSVCESLTLRHTPNSMLVRLRAQADLR